MLIYTFVLDYAGGIYVSQHKATDVNDALETWLLKLCTEKLAGDVSEDLAQAFSPIEDSPVALEGLVHVWCVTAQARRGLALANIIQTAY